VSIGGLGTARWHQDQKTFDLAFSDLIKIVQKKAVMRCRRKAGRHHNVCRPINQTCSNSLPRNQFGVQPQETRNGGRRHLVGISRELSNPPSTGSGAQNEKHRVWVPVIELYEKYRSDRELIGYGTTWLGYAATPQFSSISVKFLVYGVSSLGISPTIAISIPHAGAPEQGISSGAFVRYKSPCFAMDLITCHPMKAA
jgi:hypothetical protein